MISAQVCLIALALRGLTLENSVNSLSPVLAARGFARTPVSSKVCVCVFAWVGGKGRKVPQNVVEYKSKKRYKVFQMLASIFSLGTWGSFTLTKGGKITRMHSRLNIGYRRKQLKDFCFWRFVNVECHPFKLQ